MPRAPKSQTGVPRPSRAGTNQTSPVRLALRRPRLGRFRRRRDDARGRRAAIRRRCPAESMTASVPQVAAPPTRKATIGKVPAPPCPARGRAVARPDALVEHAAGAEGGLGQPGPGAALADERGLLVAGDAADGRCARAVRWPRPTAPDESTMRRQHGRRDAEPLEQRVVPVDGRRVDQGGDRGVGGVGHVEGVGSGARRPRASRPPSCRPCRSTARRARPVRRSGSTASRMAITLVADALGASRMPSAWSTRQVPTVRRSCQPMPGRDGLPGGALPHDGRGALVGDADAVDRPAVGAARPAPPPGRPRPCAAASNSTRPGAGRVGQHRDVVHVLDRGVGSHDGGAHARRADVDDQDAAAHRLMTRAPGRTARAARTCRVEDAVGVEGLLQPAQDLEARAERPGQEAATG